MIWAHVQKGTINTHYTPEMIKWEETPASHSATPRQGSIPALTAPRPPTAECPPQRTPRLKQHVISPARLGHSIHINKTGFLEDRAATARSGRVNPAIGDRGAQTALGRCSWCCRTLPTLPMAGSP